MIYDLQSTEDPRDIVHRSVQALVEGHVIGVPSDTVYGLVASSLCPTAVERLVRWTHYSRQRRGRTDTAGSVSLLMRSTEAAGDFLLPATHLTQRLGERCFPGPLTLVSKCDDPLSAMTQLPEFVQQQIRQTNDGNVAFRVAEHRILSHIQRYLAAPLVWGEMVGSGGTEAPINIGVGPHVTSGAIITASALHNELQAVLASLSDVEGSCPLLLDDGHGHYGGWGTVVEVCGSQWKVLREGVIQRAAMNQFVKPVIALVCTGNTCRSPMAETLLRDFLHRRFGSEDVARVVSAGVAAGRGSGATPQAIEVMGRRGLDLTGHCSQPLDDSLMSMADLVLTMTRRHRDAIVAAWPDRVGRVFTLRRDGGDVSDPVGLPVDVYQQCADQISHELAQWIDNLGADFFPYEAIAEDELHHNGDDSGTDGDEPPLRPL